MNLVIMYLAAIVAANVIVSVYGPGVSVLTAFVLIGLVITTRDRLHDMWGGNLRRNMAALIVAGSGLSLLFGGGVSRIALASGASVLVSESVDAILYHMLRGRSWYQRANGSNIGSSVVDSVLFPTLAFGVFLPWVVAGQLAAKVFGGAIWTWVLRPRAAVAALLLCVAAPLSGQVSVGVGEYHNEHVTQSVVEVVALAPSFMGFTPNAIVSWDMHGDGRPVLLPQLGRDLVVNFPVIVGFDVGASAGPWDSYAHWEPHVSARVIAFVRGPLKALSIVSWQPMNSWARAVVVKLDYTLR
tara:strand:- start:1938 stop:2834 length:897 start_codon:yes stop_codon:yes gene_type:complete